MVMVPREGMSDDKERIASLEERISALEDHIIKREVVKHLRGAEQVQPGFCFDNDGNMTKKARQMQEEVEKTARNNLKLHKSRLI